MRLNNLWSLFKKCTAKIVQTDDFSFSSLTRLYNSFADNLSKKLFIAMLDKNLNNNMVPMLKVMISDPLMFASNPLYLAQSESIANIIDFLKSPPPPSPCDCVLFGEQDVYFVSSSIFVNDFKLLGVKFSAIVMKNNQNPQLVRQYFPDINLITENEFLSTYKNENVFLLSRTCWKYDKNYLIKNGINRDKIFLLFDASCPPEYFPKDIMIPREHEIFFDGGAFDMRDSLAFINWSCGNYDSIYAFEPDIHSYNNCKAVIKNNITLQDKRIMLYNKGLFKESTQLKFWNSGGGGSHIIFDENDNITNDVTLTNTISIDELLDGREVTFIKLDIEGAELAALTGAKNTIIKWKPRLAISIYHKASDIIDIPFFILSLVPQYKLFIRHYSTCRWETVLFCICD
ncbi:MAG: FkbM family methyltransferase [Endomicrobium sp.]|jgi:FkbM family methyltransferase|nr:FkbM family methyltransferase [Endomicrobium sp.]